MIHNHIIVLQYHGIIMSRPNTRNSVISIVTLAIMFIVIGHVFPNPIHSNLSKPIAKLPPVIIDGWSATHVILFAVLAILLPNRLFELFLVGLAWELLEDIFAPEYLTQLIDCNGPHTNSEPLIRSLWCGFSSKHSYWYGKWDDLFSNSMGLILGHFISTRMLLK